MKIVLNRWNRGYNINEITATLIFHNLIERDEAEKFVLRIIKEWLDTNKDSVLKPYEVK